MATDKTERIEVRASSSLNVSSGKTPDVDSVFVQMAVNSMPIIQIGLQPAGTSSSQVKKVVASLETEKMGDLQQEIFDRQLGASLNDVTVTLKGDSETKTKTFSGHVMAPAKNLGFGLIDQQIKLVGNEISLNALRPYIYAGLPEGANQKLAEKGETETASSSNIMTRLMEVLGARADNFKNTTNSSSFNNPVNFTMARQIHNVNLQVIPLLQKIASNSPTATYEAFKLLESLEEFEQRAIRRAINDTIGNTILQCSGSFFDTFLSFLSGFQMFYVPDPTGNGAGSVKPFRDMVGDNTETKFVDPQYLSLTAEDMDYGPVQQVLVQGVPQTSGANMEKAKDEKFVVPTLVSNTIFVWPPSAGVINGNFRPVSIPFWLPDSIDLTENYRDAKVENSGGWDISRYMTEKDALRDSIVEVLKKPYLELIKEYANNIYCQTALASYLIVMKCPLDFDWKVGTRYELKDKSTGTTLFRGFASQLTHNISGLRNSLAADTTVIFSHVEYGSFYLPQGRGL